MPEGARIRIETAKGGGFELLSEASLEQVLLDNEDDPMAWLDSLSLDDDRGFVSIRELKLGQSATCGGGASPVFRITRIA